MWLQDLAQRGHDVTIEVDRLVVRSERSQTEFRLHRPRRPPRPSELRRRDEPALMLARHLSAGVRRRMEALGWSWATDDGEFSIVIDGARIRDTDISRTHGDDASTHSTSAQPPGPAPYGAAAIARLVLSAREPLTQTVLAELSGVTQPRVSQVLNALEADGLVVRHGRRGWLPLDRRRLLEHVRRQTPPSSGGVSTWWANVEADPWEATIVALPPLTAVRVSGDTAADLYAPWRRPRQSLVYTRSLIDLHHLGLVAADDPEDAVLQLVVPADRSVLAEPATTRQFRNVLVPLANPLIVLRDLEVSTGVDAGEAADALLAALPRLLGWADE